jgi:hypothetical protein
VEAASPGFSENANQSTMKSLLTGFAVLLAGLILLPATASADRIAFLGRCPNCGVSMYGQTSLVGYDRYGQPIYRTIPIGHQCPGRRFDHDHGRDHHGNYGGYDRYEYGPGYGRSNDYDHRPKRGFGFSIFR